MTVQPGLCRTWLEPNLLVFSRTGSDYKTNLITLGSETTLVSGLHARAVTHLITLGSETTLVSGLQARAVTRHPFWRSYSCWNSNSSTSSSSSCNRYMTVHLRFVSITGWQLNLQQRYQHRFTVVQLGFVRGHFVENAQLHLLTL